MGHLALAVQAVHWSRPREVATSSRQQDPMVWDHVASEQGVKICLGLEFGTKARHVCNVSTLGFSLALYIVIMIKDHLDRTTRNSAS